MLQPLISTSLYFALFLGLSAYVFSVLGLIAGIWAEKFEQINFFPTFLMLPLTFLGGVFYSVRHLPEPFRTVSLFNPVVHMVEPVRAGMLGLPESSPVGLGLLIGMSIVSTDAAWQMLARWVQTAYLPSGSAYFSCRRHCARGDGAKRLHSRSANLFKIGFLMYGDHLALAIVVGGNCEATSATQHTKFAAVCKRQGRTTARRIASGIGQNLI